MVFVDTKMDVDILLHHPSHPSARWLISVAVKQHGELL
jgi:NADPH-dependent ferric siderophore reductase